MKTRLLPCRVTLRSLFVLLFGFALFLAWVSHNYQVVQQRKAFSPHFNDHDFSVRAASVFILDEAGVTTYPRPKVSWIRTLLGDHPRGDLIYNPTKDSSGLQLRRTRELFPEAKMWGWATQPTLPDGVERLTDRHQVMI